ncbi:UNVERIFIED_CONTAM: hypothetical protein Sradi_7276700 [Sesamum radiatum]|uniref:Uncharacterized protein n=1 Tax=Sesamum radiatum TaxID=300843 RepID=A0AAW2IIX3_SESRA
MRAQFHPNPYTSWTCHGEMYIPLHISEDHEFPTNAHGDDMASMLRDAMGIPNKDDHVENDQHLNGADAETKSNHSVNLLLELLRDTFPDNVNLPANYYEVNKITTELGFSCQVIDACPNNCMLFKGYSNISGCPTKGAYACPNCGVPPGFVKVYVGKVHIPNEKLQRPSKDVTTIGEVVNKCIYWEFVNVMVI